MTVRTETKTRFTQMLADIILAPRPLTEVEKAELVVTIGYINRAMAHGTLNSDLGMETSLQLLANLNHDDFRTVMFSVDRTYPTNSRDRLIGTLRGLRQDGLA